MFLKCKCCIEKEKRIEIISAIVSNLRTENAKSCPICADKKEQIKYLQDQVHELNNRLMELVGIYHVSPEVAKKLDSVLYPDKDKEALKKGMESKEIAEREILGH